MTGVDIRLQQNVGACHRMGFARNKAGIRQHRATQQRIADRCARDGHVARVGHDDRIVDLIARILDAVAVGIAVGAGLADGRRHFMRQRRVDRIPVGDGDVIGVFAGRRRRVDDVILRRVQRGLGYGEIAREGLRPPRNQGCHGADQRRAQAWVGHVDRGQGLVAGVGDKERVADELARIRAAIAIGVNDRAGFIQRQCRCRGFRHMGCGPGIGDGDTLGGRSGRRRGVGDAFVIHIGLRHNIGARAAVLRARGQRDGCCQAAGQRRNLGVRGRDVGQRHIAGVLHRDGIGDRIADSTARNRRCRFGNGQLRVAGGVHCHRIGQRFHGNGRWAERGVDRLCLRLIHHKAVVHIGLRDGISALAVHNRAGTKGQSPPCAVKTDFLAADRADLVVKNRDIADKAASAGVGHLIVVGDGLTNGRKGRPAAGNA